MDNNYVFVEHSSKINDIIAKFNSLQRIKIKSFDVSPNYIVFGVSSGGIYILRREPCEFFKIIPSKEGSADIIAISHNEKYISIGTEKGLVIIYENFKEYNIEQQVFNDHAGNTITAMKWHDNILYIGDQSGKVSAASLITILTKAIFQVPSESVMQLDSSIVQIDIYNKYLLISTTTKACLCNTDEKCYIQIGKKIRNGYFGACFCQNLPSSESSSLDICNEDDCKIYCARPGLRVWEASLNANVIMTFQFKEALKIITPTQLLFIRYDKNATLEEYSTSDNDKIDENFNFQKIYALFGRFIFTYYGKGLYIFDLFTNKLQFWFHLVSDIRDVAILNSTLYVWQDNMELRVFSLMKLENLIMQTLYNEQYILCAEICIKYCDTLLKIFPNVKELYLLDSLTTKLANSDLKDQILYVFQQIKQHNENLLNMNKTIDDNIDENKCEQCSEENVHDNNCKILLKQYIVNKTHNIIKVPEAQKILNTLTIKDLLILLNNFHRYVSKEMNEDAMEWCYEEFLQQVVSRDMAYQDLPDICLDYLTDAVINVNKSVKYACSCGYPLPICHKYEPKYHEIIMDIVTNGKDINIILEQIPYMSRYNIKPERSQVNVTLLVQFNNQQLLKEYSKYLLFDKWYDVLAYFVKLNLGKCLNCEGPINVNGLMTWTEMATIVLESLGPAPTTRILKCFERRIPAGALNAKFYQRCIFSQLFGNNNDTKMNKTVVGFANKMEGEFYNEFQTSLEKYFNRKYLDPNYQSPSASWNIEAKLKCPICKLPLKNEVFELKSGRTCYHIFHSFCLKNYSGACSLCSE